MSKWWGFAGLVMALLVACSDDPIEIDLKVAEVVVAPDARVLSVGDTMRLTAFPRTADGTLLGGVPIGWTSDDPTIASVAGNGIFAKVEAMRAGTTRIRASSEGKIGEVTVTVAEVSLPVAAVTIAASDSIVDMDEAVQLEAVVKAADGTVLGGRMVLWSSSAPSRATVVAVGNPSIAHVTGHLPGEVVISALSEGVRGEVRMRVRAAPAPQTPVAFVMITPLTLGSWVNQSMNYAPAARAFAANGLPLEGRTITWAVSDSTVATIQPNGMLQTLKPGTTRVIAQSEGKFGFGTLVVFEYPAGSEMKYNLTYEWWDNDVHVIPEAGRTSYTDANGVTREIGLYPEAGTFTMDKFGQGNRYTQEIVLTGYAPDVNGTFRKVVEQREVDRGIVEYDLLNNSQVIFRSETRPGYTFTGRPMNYELHVTQKVGIAGAQEYRYRLPH